MKYLLFSHGFGVLKDSKGLFSSISEDFSDYKPIMFDYNEWNEKTKTMSIFPISVQVKKLENEIEQIYLNDKKAQITLIAHSQGCLVASLVSKVKLASTIFLAPAGVTPHKGKIQEFFTKREGAKLLNDNTILFPRKDGVTLRIMPDYLDGLHGYNPLELYQKFADKHALSIVVATQDERSSPVDFSKLLGVEVLEVEANHNFSGEGRDRLIEKLHQILV